MNRVLQALLLLLLSSWCFGAPQMIVFKGTVAAKYNNTYIIMTNIPSGKKDSVLVKNGTFIFKQKFTEPGLYVFTSAQDEKDYGWRAPLGVLADQPGVITLVYGKPKDGDVTIKGSTAQTIYEQFLKERQRLLQPVRLPENISPDSLKKRNNQPLLVEEIKDVVDTFTTPLALRTALKYPHSLAAPYILENYTENANMEVLEQVFYSLSEKMRNTYAGKRLQVRLWKLKSTDRGQTVADFSLSDTSGRIISFADVKDKVILINFWASWCAPCREEFKLLRYVYEKHHSKGFTIISISVDASPVLWKKALEKEQLPWLQLRDFDKVPSIAERRFGVTGLPTIFLLNGKREILYRDLRGGVLDKVIEGLVGISNR